MVLMLSMVCGVQHGRGLLSSDGRITVLSGGTVPVVTVPALIKLNIRQTLLMFVTEVNIYLSSASCAHSLIPD